MTGENKGARERSVERTAHTGMVWDGETGDIFEELKRSLILHHNFYILLRAGSGTSLQSLGCSQNSNLPIIAKKIKIKISGFIFCTDLRLNPK